MSDLAAKEAAHAGRHLNMATRMETFFLLSAQNWCHKEENRRDRGDGLEHGMLPGGQ